MDDCSTPPNLDAQSRCIFPVIRLLPSYTVSVLQLSTTQCHIHAALPPDREIDFPEATKIEQRETAAPLDASVGHDKQSGPLPGDLG